MDSSRALGVENISILEPQQMKRNVPSWSEKENHRQLVHHIDYLIAFVGQDLDMQLLTAQFAWLAYFKVPSYQY